MTTSMPGWAPRPYRATLPFVLGGTFFAVLSFPALVDLPGGVTPGQILMLASFPIWFAAGLSRERSVFDAASNLAAAAILMCSGWLIFWSLLSALQVEDPFRSARQSISLLTAFALFFLVAGTVTGERLFRYITVLSGALTVTSVVTVCAFAAPALQEIIFQGGDRAFGFFKNPNQFGIAISTVIPVTLALAYAAPRHRMIWGASIIFLGLGLMGSGSKANLLVTAVTLPMCLLMFTGCAYSGEQRVFRIALTALGCVLAAVLLILTLSIVNPRALSLLGDVVIEGEATHSLVSRSRLWADSITLMSEHPVFGVGAGERIHDLSHSHNVVLDFARTLGVPGMVLISAKLIAILGISASTILLALRTSAASLLDRCICIGLAFGPIAYVGANLSSDSLGPTTSPFLYSTLFLALAARTRLTVLVEDRPALPDERAPFSSVRTRRSPI